MTPTPKLRFVERQHGYRTTVERDMRPNMVRILQQWWEYNSGAIPNCEWRDVPVEKEQA